MSKLAAIILAAGVSSRMGNFKPLLPVDGETMIRRVVGSMQKAGADPVIVVTGYKHEILEDHLTDCGVTFAHNEHYYSTQMLDSLLLGAAALPREAERVLITPADVPLVEEATVAALLHAQGDFIRPTYQGKPGHPVVRMAGRWDGSRRLATMATDCAARCWPPVSNRWMFQRRIWALRWTAIPGMNMQSS